MTKRKRIRIRVCIDELENWYAESAGDREQQTDLGYDTFVADGMPDDEGATRQFFWVEVDVPVPKTNTATVVQGAVVKGG